MIQTPDTFGAYALERRIAVGGMAEIFKATTRGAGGGERVVAIKRLHRHMSDDPELAQMLVEEAKLAVQLQHPNIGQIFDLGSLDGQYFIVMEFIDGVDLMQILRECKEKGWRIPPEIASWIMTEMLDALEFAHSAHDVDGRPLNIVHRDISPQNVMVTYNGDVKLVDFGIAKAEAQAMQTQAGIIKGKFYYMSPEQAFGHKLDRRSDVFAAGMVLYELLTGRPGYEEAGDLELIRCVRKAEFPPPSHYQRDLDPALERVVMSALARDKNRRLESARAMQIALKKHARSSFDPVSRLDVGQFVSELFGRSRPVPRHAKVMSRDEFAPSDTSVIYSLSDLAPTNPDQVHAHFAESYFDGPDGAMPHDATSLLDNPFTADEPTTLFTRDDDEDDTSGWSAPRHGRAMVPADSSYDATSVAISSSPAHAPSGDANPFAIPDTFSASPPHDDVPPGFALPPSPHSAGSAPLTSSRGAVPVPSGFGPPPSDYAAAKAAFTPPPERTAMVGLVPILERLGVEQLNARRTRMLVAGGAAALALGMLGVIMLFAFGGDSTEDELEALYAGEVEVPEKPAEEPVEPEVVQEPPAPTLATLEVSSSPPNARVFLDESSKGTTPLALPDLEIGRAYDLRLELDGREPWSQTITVGAQNDPIEITLDERVAGILQVITEPAGLKVDLDGEPAGESPVTIPDIDRSANHFIVVHKADGTIHQEVVRWLPDDEPAKTINLRIAQATDAALPGIATDAEKAEKKKKIRRRRRRKKKKTKALDPWSGSKKKNKKLDPWGD